MQHDAHAIVHRLLTMWVCMCIYRLAVGAATSAAAAAAAAAAASQARRRRRLASMSID